MPPAEDPVPDHDNALDEPHRAASTAPAASDTAHLDTEEAWGYSASPPKAPKKKKKGKKQTKSQAPADEGDDSAPYPKSITPSPPIDHGVRLQAAPSLPTEVAALIDVEDEVPEEVSVANQDPVAMLVADVPPALHSPLTTPAVPANNPSFSGRRNQHVRDRPDFQPNLAAGGHAVSVHSRRPSFMAQQQQGPRFVDAPQPHLPQAHFFGLPDLGFGLGKQESGRMAGADGYCCRLDSFADAGNETCARKAKDVLLVGSDGGLEVFRILPNKLELVGRLEGLRGAVIDAKILPHVDRSDVLSELRPLVAVITHGPMLEIRHDSGPEGDSEHDAVSSCQTTLDVYSLQTQRHLATLYASVPVTMGQVGLGQAWSLPRPVGDFEIDAQGPFIVLSSGKTGEIFVFTAACTEMAQALAFRCIGKFWTSIQKPVSLRSGPNNELAVGATGLPQEPQTAIYSLSTRWLALVPPASSSIISVGGFPLTSETNPNPPGVATHAAPSPPQITCEVLSTDTEGTWGRLGRQAAQGLVKVSQKGFEMGLQGWKEFTQPSPPGHRVTQDHAKSHEEFPPTKAPTHDLQAPREPALVSLIDLNSLLHWELHKLKHVPAPIATFALLDGCNFVSLSSAGTRLLTSSRKGETSTVWDLAQAAHGVAIRTDSNEVDTSTCPSITQLVRIARTSQATVLSCVWTKDDDAIAMLTNHGTIHLHEVPARSPNRKRKRTAPVAATGAEKADATVSLSTGLSPPSSGFLGSIKSWSQSVSTQVNSIRTNSPASAFALPTTFAGFREVTAAAGNAGSRAVARGLSQGLSAAKGASSDYWHADDNKIRHTKAMQIPLAAKSLRWIKRNSTTSVAVACGGTVHVHPVQRVTRRKGAHMVTSLKHERYAHKAFPLPPIASRAGSTGTQAADVSCIGQGPHGFWSLRDTPAIMADPHRGRSAVNPHGSAPISDVETNAPYCPFHVGSQIGIYAYDEMEHSQYRTSPAFASFQQRGHGGEGLSWAFGESLPTSTKINEQMPDEFRQSSYGHDRINDDDDDEDVASQMESKLTIQPPSGKQPKEQILRVNTRRKGRFREGNDAHDAPHLMEDDEGFV